MVGVEANRPYYFCRDRLNISKEYNIELEEAKKGKIRHANRGINHVLLLKALPFLSGQIFVNKVTCYS